MEARSCIRPGKTRNELPVLEYCHATDVEPIEGDFFSLQFLYLFGVCKIIRSSHDVPITLITFKCIRCIYHQVPAVAPQ